MQRCESAMILQVTALSRLCIDYHEYYTSIQSTFKTDFLFFLEMIGLTEKHSGSYIAWYE